MNEQKAAAAAAATKWPKMLPRFRVHDSARPIPRFVPAGVTVDCQSNALSINENSFPEIRILCT